MAKKPFGMTAPKQEKTVDEKPMKVSGLPDFMQRAKRPGGMAAGGPVHTGEAVIRKLVREEIGKAHKKMGMAKGGSVKGYAMGGMAEGEEEMVDRMRPMSRPAPRPSPRSVPMMTEEQRRQARRDMTPEERREYSAPITPEEARRMDPGMKKGGSVKKMGMAKGGAMKNYANGGMAKGKK